MRLITLLFFILSLKIYSQEIPQLDTLVLRNGLKVYLLKYGQDSILNIRLLVNGGQKNETSCQVGYSEIIQQLFKETLKEKQNSALKKKKATCELSNGQTLLIDNCLTKDFNKEMFLLSSTVLKLSFKSSKMDKVVGSIIDSYKPENISLNSTFRAFTNLFIYGNKNPLGRTYCQYQTQKVIPDELREFYYQHYTPKKTSLLICGNFNVEEVKKIITRQFSRWKTLRKEEKIDAANLNPLKIKNREIIFVNKRNSKWCSLKWMLSSPTFKSFDYAAFSMTCYLFNLYLIKKAGERDLVSRDSLTFKSLVYTHNFTEIDCYVNHNEMLTTIAMFDTLLESFCKLKFTETEINSAMQKMKTDFLEKNSSQDILTFYNPLIYDFNSRKNYCGNLLSVSSSNIQLIIKKYFNSEAYKLLIVGKENPAYNILVMSKHGNNYQNSDFQICDETCIPPKARWKPHDEQPRLFCRDCWKLGRFWGKNRSKN